MAGEKVYIADKETLDKIYNILAVDPIYGFIEHMNILSPTQRIEYIGLNKNFTPVSRNTNGSISLNDWAGFEILEANKPYMVRSDGTPDYRLQDNDYTKKYSDGSASDVANTSYDGGAFSWLQKIYKNETVVGDDRIVFLSTPSARRATAKTERKYSAFVSLYTSLHKLQRGLCKASRRITPLLAQSTVIPVRSIPENHVHCLFALAGHQKISTLSCANSGCSPTCSTLVW